MQSGLICLRAFATSARILAAPLSVPSTRNGDPGPQAARFRKSQRKAIREGQSTASVGGLDQLDQLLSAQLENVMPGRRTKSSTRFRPQEGRRPSFTGRRAGVQQSQSEDAFATSIRLKKILQPKQGGRLSTGDMDKAIKLVFETSRSAMSIPVWNMLLSAIGKERRLELMWKTFNDMKKRGYKPNSRTYTTLLNAYAGLRHSLDTVDKRGPPLIEPKSRSRVSIIYDQAQTYLSARLAAYEEAQNRSDPDELGLATDAQPDHVDIYPAVSEDLNVGPTNAYLKFLASARMYSEMDKVFVAMPMNGPLSPDTITYTTMFSALYDSLNTSHASETSGMMTSPSGLWSRMCRQFLSPADNSPGESDKTRIVDQTVVLVALKCLSRSDQQSQRMVMDLVESIWKLPRPGVGEAPLLRGNSAFVLPKLALTVPAATTIMSVCPRPTDRSHYAHLFLNRPELQKDLDTPFLIAAIRALSETGDINDVREILDNYQPRQPNHWPMSVWHDALTAARWSKSEEQGMRTQPDFAGALAMFRRMTHLPPGIENGKQEGEYRPTSPKSQPSDLRGVRWAQSPAIVPDAKALSLLIKTALGRGWREVEQAINVYDHFHKVGTATGTGKFGGRQWDHELAKDVERATERLLERQLPPDQGRTHKRRIQAAQQTLSVPP